MSDVKPSEKILRACDGCTKCCDGWLSANIFGHDMLRGTPCHYNVGGKCGIYKKRPDDPCRSYECEWLRNPEIPGWMKPNEINAIINLRKRGQFVYLEVVEAGETLRADVLSWMFIFCLKGGINLMYSLKGGVYKIGNSDFVTQDISQLPIERLTPENLKMLK